MKYSLSAIILLLLFSLPVRAQNPVRNLPEYEDDDERMDNLYHAIHF